MVALDSHRWKSFATYFGSPDELPNQVQRWQASIGTVGEKSAWADVSERFLHQSTITEAAYAVAPYVTSEFDRVPLLQRLNYLIDLGLIEAAQFNGGPVVPDDLADAYLQSVQTSRRHAVQCLSLPWPQLEFRYLMSTIATLHRHPILGDLLFTLDSIAGSCPTCGDTVYPAEIQDSGYCGHQPR